MEEAKIDLRVALEASRSSLRTHELGRPARDEMTNARRGAHPTIVIEI